MSGLAAAIRLRRRQLDSLALDLAAQQAAAHALTVQTEALTGQRAAERHLAAAAPISCDLWFAEGTRHLAALAKARIVADDRLADLRGEAVQVRARLQLLEDAAADARRAADRRREAKAAAALDDRIAAAWSRR